MFGLIQEPPARRSRSSTISNDQEEIELPHHRNRYTPQPPSTARGTYPQKFNSPQAPHFSTADGIYRFRIYQKIGLWALGHLAISGISGQRKTHCYKRNSEITRGHCSEILSSSKFPDGDARILDFQGIQIHTHLGGNVGDDITVGGRDIARASGDITRLVGDITAISRRRPR